jgi:hypothetical protein
MRNTQPLPLGTAADTETARVPAPTPWPAGMKPGAQRSGTCTLEPAGTRSFARVLVLTRRVTSEIPAGRCSRTHRSVARTLRARRATDANRRLQRRTSCAGAESAILTPRGSRTGAACSATASAGQVRVSDLAPPAATVEERSTELGTTVGRAPAAAGRAASMTMATVAPPPMIALIRA